MLSRAVAATVCLALVCGVSGCKKTAQDLPPYGEVLVDIDTDLTVPSWVSRVRIDVFGGDGTWLDSRDYALASKDDLPISMSVFTEDESTGRDVFLRVRGYPDGAVRDYLGERFTQRPATYAEPAYAASMADACGAPIALAADGTATGRLRRAPFADGGSVTCGMAKSLTGLVAFALTVPADGSYRVEVIAASPSTDAGDTILSIRSSCADPTTEAFCNDDLDALDTISGGTTNLAAGSYVVLVGNKGVTPMDVTIKATPADHFEDSTPPTTTEPTPSGPPRLLIGGLDVTPSTEPDPALSVDSLVELHIASATQSTAKITLSGSCLAEMSDLVNGTTCVAGTRIGVAPLPLTSGRARSTVTLAGTWAGLQAVPCIKTPNAGTTSPDGSSHDDASLCIPGGTFVLGNEAVAGAGTDSGTPRRVARMSPFLADKYELTVARYRALVASGFVSSDGTPFAETNPTMPATPTEPLGQRCTYNANTDGSARYPERESEPLTCVSWYAAREICQALGGDLPSVAQREWMASASSRTDKTIFPWGDEDPSCDTMAWGRFANDEVGSTGCSSDGSGPVAVDAAPWSTGDVTPDGVIGLAGNAAEWTLDAHVAYSDPCWLVNGPADPICQQVEAPLRSVMGGAWRYAPSQAQTSVRLGVASGGYDDVFGFRCVYPGGGS